MEAPVSLYNLIMTYIKQKESMIKNLTANQ